MPSRSGKLVESDTRFAAPDADFADLRDSVYALRVNRGVFGFLDGLSKLGRKLDLLAAVQFGEANLRSINNQLYSPGRNSRFPILKTVPQPIGLR